MKRLGSLIAASLLLGGCSSMSGLSGNNEFACKAPDGVSCESVSGVYANSLHNNLPSQQVNAHKKGGEETSNGKPIAPLPAGTPAAPVISPRDLATMDSGMPLREPPRILRVWLAPWEDELGDLHDQKYFYTVVNPGQWRMEANKQAIQDQFRPVYPLSKTKPAAETKPSSKSSGLTGTGSSTRPLGVPAE